LTLQKGKVLCASHTHVAKAKPATHLRNDHVVTCL